jgi:hypothetical protein
MGLFSKRIKNPIRGSAQIVSATAHDGHATSQNCRMDLVVQAEGVPAYSTSHHCMAKARKWPQPGMTLPVTIERDDPSRLRIEWDEVPNHDEVGAQQADQMAAMLRGEQPTGGTAPGAQVLGGANINVGAQQFDASNPLHKQALDQAEAATGMDLDGDGKVAGRGAAAATPGQPQEDPNEERIEQLERLVKLRDSGALSATEFEQQKKQILGS